MRTHINMVKPSANETGIYRFDGSSLNADITQFELTQGTYIARVKFYEERGILEFIMSTGQMLSVSNFLTIASLDLEASIKRGITGVNGVNGLSGKDGKDGLTGASGDKGPIGSIGLRGEAGDRGLDGDYGDDGPQGPVGLTGPKGKQGPSGLRGRQGNIGPSGTDGVKNIFLSQYAPDKTNTDAVKNPLWINTR